MMTCVDTGKFIFVLLAEDDVGYVVGVLMKRMRFCNFLRSVYNEERVLYF